MKKSKICGVHQCSILILQVLWNVKVWKKFHINSFVVF